MRIPRALAARARLAGEGALSTRHSYMVRVHRTIAEVPAHEWDALVGPDDLQASHRFVSVCERSGVAGATYRHVLVHEGGALAGIASLCVIRVRLDLLATGVARSIARAVRRVRPGFLEVPIVFCGLPVSFGQSLLRIHPDADRAAVLTAVDEAAEELARESDARIICSKEHSDAELQALAPLERRGYRHLPSLPFCRLAISWSSFHEYLEAMRAGYRRQIVSALRARDRNGVQVRLTRDVTAECARIVPLYQQVMDRADFQLERLPALFFTELSRTFADEISAIIVDRDGETLASAVLLRSPRTATFLLAGINYAAPRALQGYPTLVTAVVANAIESGASTLEMGQTSYALKQRLGAVPVARHLLLRPRGAWLRSAFTAGAGHLFPEQNPPFRRVFADRASLGDPAPSGSAESRAIR